ncbi:MAG TPA: amidohydrolase family protein [Bryobacteraceae bacterium]|jgi:hypothetical protein|nr:amidohydrolase family protein [Bryobacteraceae bacterium]
MKLLAAGLLLSLSLPAAVVIEDVTIIDVRNGAARPHRNVVIQGNRIVSIGGLVPAGAAVVSGRGKFLIPGMWNMHVHLEGGDQLAGFLAQGVTGVEDMGSDFARVTEWREAIESGKAAGPHIVSSGPPVADRVSRRVRFPELAAPNPREARKAFDRLWDMDVDFIKVQPDLTADAYIALAEQARHWHLRVEGAVPLAVSAWDALEAHQNTIDLSSVLKAVSTDAEAIDFFERCAMHGIRIEPMLAELQRSGSERIKDVYRLVALSTRTEVELLAGAGSNATVQDELEQMVAAGLTPQQALRAATIAPARFFESEDMGTVEAGKLADLVLLNANPLVEIGNVREIAGVFSRGKYYSRTSLKAMAPAH